MKNLKIEINAEQPLDEVVKELERLGYRKASDMWRPTKCLVTFKDGLIDWFYGGYRYYDLTTLQQLREMK